MKKDNLERMQQMRSVAYISLIDAMKGLKEATRLIDERIQRDGPNANFSMDSDLLSWSQTVWRASNRLYALDQIIEELKISNNEVKDVPADSDVNSSGE
jgi:hypothetical protein